MQRFARAAARFDELVSQATLWICAALLTVMVVVTALGVVFRYVLRSSLSWSDEFAAYLFVWLTCLGASVGLRARIHPAIRVFADRFPERMQPFLHAFTDFVVIALGLIFVFYGGGMIALMGNETAASIPISMVYPFLAIPISGGLFVFHASMHLVQLLLHAVRVRRSGLVGTNVEAL